MKNKKNPISSDSMFKSKGFYVALYSCIGVLLVGSIAVSYSLMNSQIRSESNDLDFNDLQPTINQNTSSYALSQQEMENYYYGDTAIGGISDFFKSDGDEEESNDDGQQPSTTENETSEQPTEEENDVAAEEPVEADPVFNVFGDNDTMMWPVSGEILMSYSVDSMVFDQTLNQFRTNDSINIAASQGTQVRASADGIISSVSHTRRDGNKVVIDHGNGWTTTYSQLQDSILVSEGDVVLAGEVIGEVGNPSIFTSELGDNLGFKVTQGDSTVDPTLVLAEAY